MDSNTLLTIGVVALVAVTLFVTAHAGAVAVGLLPPARGTDDATREERDPDSSRDTEADERASVGDVADRSRITAADHERIRSHLEKDRFHRRPDDLLPSEDDGS